MMNYNEYYKCASANFDNMRLDNNEEVEEHCSWFMDGFETTQQSTLLDIGCGTGRYTHSFAKKGFLAIGIDKSPDQIALASNRIPVMLADGLTLNFPEKSFNVVTLILMIQQIHADDLLLLFSNIITVLRDKGRVWIKTCSHSDVERRPFNDLFPSAININLARYPSIYDLILFAASIGLICNRQANVCNQYMLTGKDLLDRFEARHNTTLQLVPQEEYLRAIPIMKKKYSYESSYEFQHYHTLIEFIKN